MLFCPDQFLGAHVQRITGRENMHIWMGECHVHAGINGADLRARVEAEPDAELFIHPECGCATSALYLAGAGVVPIERTKILSTSGMVAAAARRPRPKVLVATETGMLHQLRKANPLVDLRAGQPGRRVQVHEDDHRRQAAAFARDGTDEVDVPTATSPIGPGPRSSG